MRALVALPLLPQAGSPVLVDSAETPGFSRALIFGASPIAPTGAASAVVKLLLPDNAAASWAGSVGNLVAWNYSVPYSNPGRALSRRGIVADLPPTTGMPRQQQQQLYITFLTCEQRRLPEPLQRRFC